MTTDILLNQLKTPIAILFDKINIRNNTSLNYLDFDLSEPIPVQIFGSTVNTKCTVVPKTASSFYKTQDIFFERLDFSDILSNPAGEIIPNNAATLFELLPQINRVFGINLLHEDVYDTPTPVYDYNSIPGTVTITVKAKPNSFLFTGTYDLLLGPKIEETTVAPFNVAYFVHTQGYSTVDYLRMLTSINSDGTQNTDFSFLRNATDIKNVKIDKVIQLNDGTLVLNGDFTFTARLGSAVVASPVTCKAVVIRLDGSVLSTSAASLFSSDIGMDYYENKAVAFKYVVDTTINPANVNSIYRYGQDGLLDTSFVSTDIKYTPTLLSVCPDGKVYTVSPAFSAPLSVNNSIASRQIRIDRINADGTIDTSFSPVVISGNGSDAPLPVANIVPLLNNGFWMLIQPLYGVATTSVSPVVNGIPSVPGNTVEAYSWNPIFRVSQTGAVNRLFSSSLKNHLDKSVFDYPGSNLSVGDASFIADELSVTFFTQKSNPVTGYEFRQPLVFDNQARIRYLSGVDYEKQWRWVSAKEIIAEPDGKFVSFGKLSVTQIDGSYGPINYCIAKYKKSGAIDNLIYRQPLTTTLGVALTMVNVLSYKK